MLSEAVETKSFAELSALEARVTQLAADRAELNDQQANAEHSANFAAKMFDGTDQADEKTRVSKAFQLGRNAYPLGMSRASLKMLHSAVSKRQTVTVKAFSTVDSLLPATLDGSVLGQIHENRLLDRLLVQAIGTPSYEIIVHNSTTGAPTPVSKGGLKPEVVLNTTPVTYTAIKIAAHVGISYES